MGDSTKVLAGLMERRALEAQFAQLAEMTDPQQVSRLVEEIASHGRTALSMLLAKLDTGDPQVRGGLGLLAKRLDREQTVAALRGVARSRGRSDQARLSALTILRRYLDEPGDDSLLAGIQDPDSAALRSLIELIQAMERDPAAILEYLTQLAEQPSDVAGMILDAVPRMPSSPHLVTLLRMLAQGESQPLARSAIEQLGRTRMPEALLALESLLATLPPPLSSLTERSLRKLGMSGVRMPETQGEARNWRALLSPVDGAGSQVILFISQVTGSDLGRMLTVVTRDPDGIVASFGSTEVPGDKLPPSQPPGRIFTPVQEDDAPTIEFAEVPFDEGRYAVRQALELNWAGGTVPPLAYRWLNPLLWNGSEMNVAEALAEPGPYPASQVTAILDHPAFATWFWWSDALLDVARRSVVPTNVAARERQISALASAHFGPQVISSYQRRLQRMARWLALTTQPEAATMAMSAASHLTRSAPAESPFVRRLIGTGLDVAVVSLQASRI